MLHPNYTFSIWLTFGLGRTLQCVHSIVFGKGGNILKIFIWLMAERMCPCKMKRLMLATVWYLDIAIHSD